MVAHFLHSAKGDTHNKRVATAELAHLSCTVWMASKQELRLSEEWSLEPGDGLQVLWSDTDVIGGKRPREMLYAPGIPHQRGWSGKQALRKALLRAGCPTSHVDDARCRAWALPADGMGSVSFVQYLDHVEAQKKRVKAHRAASDALQPSSSGSGSSKARNRFAAQAKDMTGDEALQLAVDQRVLPVREAFLKPYLRAQAKALSENGA